MLHVNASGADVGEFSSVIGGPSPKGELASL